MARDRSFANRVVGLLMPLGPIEARAMFGGWGIYLEGVIFALISHGRLFFKVDEETKDQFAHAGSRPFSYRGRSRPVELPYWETPAGSLKSSETLLPWAELGLAAARRAQAKKGPKQRPQRRSAG
ncbi:MAG: TfoX/Sxy family protein [Kiloniellales bacterium]